MVGWSDAPFGRGMWANASSHRVDAVPTPTPPLDAVAGRLIGARASHNRRLSDRRVVPRLRAVAYATPRVIDEVDDALHARFGAQRADVLVTYFPRGSRVRLVANTQLYVELARETDRSVALKINEPEDVDAVARVVGHRGAYVGVVTPGFGLARAVDDGDAAVGGCRECASVDSSVVSLEIKMVTMGPDRFSPPARPSAQCVTATLAWWPLGSLETLVLNRQRRLSSGPFICGLESIWRCPSPWLAALRGRVNGMSVRGRTPLRVARSTV